MSLMGIIDMWSPLMIAFVVVQVVLALVMWQVRKPNKGDTDGAAPFAA
jgi:heme/copper-type cytochrome/quinol oxidase subunit 2